MQTVQNLVDKILKAAEACNGFSLITDRALEQHKYPALVVDDRTGINRRISEGSKVYDQTCQLSVSVIIENGTGKKARDFNDLEKLETQFLNVLLADPGINFSEAVHFEANIGGANVLVSSLTITGRIRKAYATGE